MWIPTIYLTNATYTTSFALTLMVNVVVVWLFCGIISNLSAFFAIKFGSKTKVSIQPKRRDSKSLDESHGSNRILLKEMYHPATDMVVRERRRTDELYETFNTQKNKPLRYIESFFSWLSWIFFASIPTCYAAFNLIPIWLGILLSFIVLNIRFWKSVYTNCPLVVTKDQHLRKIYRQVVSTMFRMHKKMFIFGFVCTIALAVFMNMGTYKSCINDHVAASYGVSFNDGDFLYSSALIRLMTIKDVCKSGPPCHVYATLPFDGSTSVFLNVHTHVDTTNITLKYDTLQNKTTNGGLGYQAFSSYMISPSAYDIRGQRNIHTVLLTALQPDETYVFEIFYDGAVQYTSNYQTLPSVNSNSSYNLTYGGDLGVSAATQAGAQVVAAQNPRAIMIGGDLAYDNGEAYCYYNMDLTLFMLEQNIFAKLGRIVPITLTVGNHDVGFNSLATVNMPINENGPSYYLGFPQHYPVDANGNEEIRVPTVTERITYHAHMIGNVLNVALDPGYMTPYDGEQLTWLRNISSAYEQYAKIGVYHDPIISACLSTFSAQGVEDGLTTWIPTFDDYNYMAVFEHHTHTFKRSFPLRELIPTENGTIYFGEGDWGVNPTACKFDNTTGFFESYASVNHIWVVNVDQGNSVVKYTALITNGSLVEEPVNQDMLAYSGVGYGSDEL